MADAAAAVNVPIIAPPPAAAAPAVTENIKQPASSGKFAERWDAMEAKLGTGEENAAEAEAANTTQAEPHKSAKPAADAKPKSGEATAGDRGMFEALAKKLGYTIDGKGVLPSDRISWENAKKRQEEGLAAREAKVKEAEAGVSSSPRVQKAESILKAIEEGDPDGFASAVGKKNFNEFQEEFIKRLADPNYSKLKELEQWKESQSKAEEDRKKKTEELQKTQEYKQQRQAYLNDLVEKSKTSTDPVVAAMHDDPLFVDAIFRIQQQQYKASGERILPPEEALDKAVQGAKQPFRAELKQLAEKLAKAFGLTAPTAPAATEAKPKRVAPRTAVTPPNTTDAAGANKKVSEMTSKEWREYSRKRYAEAAEKDDD